MTGTLGYAGDKYPRWGGSKTNHIKTKRGEKKTLKDRQQSRKTPQEKTTQDIQPRTRGKEAGPCCGDTMRGKKKQTNLESKPVINRDRDGDEGQV